MTWYDAGGAGRRSHRLEDVGDQLQELASSFNLATWLVKVYDFQIY